MRFCPNCDNVLFVKKKYQKDKKLKEVEKFLFCPSCGYKEGFDVKKDKDSYTLKEKLQRSGKDKTVILSTTVNGSSITEEDREAREEFFNPDSD